jgi:hypothetical protein
MIAMLLVSKQLRRTIEQVNKRRMGHGNADAACCQNKCWSYFCKHGHVFLSIFVRPHQPPSRHCLEDETPHALANSIPHVFACVIRW